ncbi:MAG: tyrosine-type recombinase/integrase, partial [Solirubrobacteraceae bacterium]
ASELASLRCQHLNLGAGWVRCEGKGRKERCTPISHTARQVLRVWLRELGGDPAGPLFPSRSGGHLTRGGIWRLVIKHTDTARQRCPSVERRLNPAREMPFAPFMAGMAVVAVAGFVRF